jgi:hypothetical protein
MLADDADKQPLSGSRRGGLTRYFRRGRHSTPRRYRSLIVVLAACVVLVLVTVTAVVLTRPAAPAHAVPAAAVVDTDASRSVPDEVSRGYTRSPATSSPPTPSAVPPPPPPPPPAPPKPVAGLNQAQMNNASVVVDVGRKMGLPARAHLVAVSTTLQESQLRNLANPAVPDSLRFPNQGVGYDHDSLGLFQQRVSQSWGTVAQLMDPATASTLFYSRLVKVAGWQTMSIATAAQAVQRSAFPDAYGQQQARAQLIVAAL